MTSESDRLSDFVDINGAPLYYEVQGEGRALLLVHAGVADCRMWDEQFDAFARRFKVIRFDLRGYGRSQAPARKFAHHDDVRGLLDSLHVERAHVVGISFGGQVGLDFALAYPERVSSLVLGAPSVSGSAPSDDVRRFVEAEDSALERRDLDGATELNVRMWVDGPNRTPEQVNPAVRERVREMQYLAFTIPVPDGCEVQRLDPPAIARLAEVRAPALVIVGDQDVASVIARAEQVAAEIPGARKVVMPGVAHMLNMEQPEAFNRIVLDFLGER